VSLDTVVEIELLGRTWKIRSDEPAEKVHAAAKIVRERIERLQAAGGAIANDRLMTLVALNLAGELIDARAEAAAEIQSLLHRLDALVLQAEELANAPLR